PARYVSGYLAPYIARTASSAPPELASHAWIEALLPGAGWTGFDPTHRTRTMIRHIRVAVGRDYNDLPPVSGVYESKGGARRMAYELDVSLGNPGGSVALASTSSPSKSARYDLILPTPSRRFERSIGSPTVTSRGS